MKIADTMEIFDANVQLYVPVQLVTEENSIGLLVHKTVHSKVQTHNENLKVA